MGLKAFDQLGSVSGQTGGGSYFKCGSYIVQLESVKAGVSKQKLGEYAAAEFVIVKSLAPLAGSNQPGERVSAVFMFDRNTELALQDFKSLIGACVGAEPNAAVGTPGYLTPEEWSKAASGALEANGRALAGALIKVDVVSKVAKKSGKVLDIPRYYAISDDQQAKYMAEIGQK